MTRKLIKEKQPFLRATGCPDLIYIPIKLHEDILNGYRVMERNKMVTDGWTDNAMP